MKQHVTTLIQFVTMLFAAFGGFLTTVAPPPGANGQVSAVGLASFGAVVILLLIKLILGFVSDENFINIGVPVLAGISGIAFLWIGISYLNTFDKYAFRYPDTGPDAEILLAADTYSSNAEDLVARNPALEGAHAQLLAELGGREKIGEVWPPNKIVEQRAGMMRQYVCMVLFLSLCLGLAIEGLARQSRAK